MRITARHRHSLRRSKQAARPAPPRTARPIALPISAIGQLSSNLEALTLGPRASLFDDTTTALRRSAVMYDWLSEHSFEIGLTAGFLGLVLIAGIAMLDFI